MSHRKELTGEILLAILAVGGAVAVTVAVAVMPGLAHLLTLLLPQERYSRKQVRRGLYHLTSTRLVSVKRQGDRTVLALTERGRKRALAYRLDRMTVKRTAAWDGSWRVVAFDIPTRLRKARDLFRSRLKRLGFYQLQKSVWIHAYPCEREVEFLAHLYHVWPYVKVMTVNRLPDPEERHLRHFFTVETPLSKRAP